LNESAFRRLLLALRLKNIIDQATDFL
jgi:hypothetical protein